MNYANVAKNVSLLKMVRLIPSAILKIGIYYTESVKRTLLSLPVPFRVQQFYQGEINDRIEKKKFTYSRAKKRLEERSENRSYTFSRIFFVLFLFFHNERYVSFEKEREDM